MKLAIKSIILDIVVSTILTLAGNGSFSSFVFLLVILMLPAILIFVTIDTITSNGK